MFCKKCGTQIVEGTKFCRVCGTPVPVAMKQEVLTEQGQETSPGSGVDPGIHTGKIPDVKTSPKYQDPEEGSGLTRLLALVAVICVILAILGVLGVLLFPKIKGKIDESGYNGTYKKAQVAYDNGQYEEAKGFYIKLLEREPENADLYIELAKTYKNLDDIEEAISTLVDGYKATGYSSDGTKGDDSILELLEEYLEENGQTLEDVKIVIGDKTKDDDSGSSSEDSKEEAEEDEAAPEVPASNAYTGEKKDIDIEVRQVDNSNFPHVTVYVSVTDKNGNPIEDLDKTDFNITEIDKNGNVSNAALNDVYRILGEDRINVNLVLDASGSMGGGKMGQAKNAASSLLDYMSLDTGDRVEVISFDDYVYLQQDFTSRKELLAAAVDGISAGGNTALFDAIYAGVYQTYYEKGAKCVIAFTDGEENCSSYSFDDVVTIAKNTSIPVYIIGIGDYSYDSSILQQLATECSGRYYSANDTDLESIREDIYIGIYQEQRDYYVFEYTSSNMNDMTSFRDLVIDTSDTTQYSGHYVKSYVPESDVTGAFSEDYMNKDYIIDYSSDRELVASDLQNLSLAELRIARNEIFARHGRQFKDPFLNQWFYSKNWYLSIPNKYAPDYFDTNHPDRLTKLETQNVTFIRNYEDAILATQDIFPKASTELLTDYDMALRKEDLKAALAQMNRYNSTPTLEENKKLVQAAIDNPDVVY